MSERTKQFGLLSSVGATKKQLRRMVTFEALTVSAIGIPLGILVGIGGIGITLLLLGDKSVSYTHLNWICSTGLYRPVSSSSFALANSVRTK